MTLPEEIRAAESAVRAVTLRMETDSLGAIRTAAPRADLIGVCLSLQALRCAGQAMTAAAYHSRGMDALLTPPPEGWPAEQPATLPSSPI